MPMLHGQGFFSGGYIDIFMGSDGLSGDLITKAFSGMRKLTFPPQNPVLLRLYNILCTDHAEGSRQKKKSEQRIAL